jgi:hypothetical protein
VKSLEQRLKEHLANPVARGISIYSEDAQKVLALLAAAEKGNRQFVSVGQALGDYTQPSDVDAMNALDKAIADMRAES